MCLISMFFTILRKINFWKKRNFSSQTCDFNNFKKKLTFYSFVSCALEMQYLNDSQEVSICNFWNSGRALNERFCNLKLFSAAEQRETTQWSRRSLRQKMQNLSYPTPGQPSNLNVVSLIWTFQFKKFLTNSKSWNFATKLNFRKSTNLGYKRIS